MNRRDTLYLVFALLLWTATTAASTVYYMTTAANRCDNHTYSRAELDPEKVDRLLRLSREYDVSKVVILEEQYQVH